VDDEAGQGDRADQQRDGGRSVQPAPVAELGQAVGDAHDPGGSQDQAGHIQR
jgi:hypothetical protein